MKTPDIRTMREAAGMSRYKAAKLLGCTNATYQRWEDFPEKLTIANYIKICELFKQPAGFNTSTQKEPIKAEPETSWLDDIASEEPEPETSWLDDIASEEPEPEPEPKAEETQGQAPEPKVEETQGQVPVLKTDVELPPIIDAEKINRLITHGITGFPAADQYETILNFCKSFDLSKQYLPALLNAIYPTGAPIALFNLFKGDLD